MSASKVHLFLAALMGASGMALWAMAAHIAGGAGLVTPAQILLIHGCSVLGLTACRKQGLIHELTASLATATLILGAVLFCGDIAARILLGGRIFPGAAPLGGSLLIAGWLAIGVAAALGNRRD